ncbi:hypothetical protein [Streptomyces sp. MH60]|uniref:hypothetical protein n=1 Tax=Streptomyces sp. MH60 TaxID=1940758 RepID=UPI000CEF3F3B|nr:hypothetical protein [Streptomyces sp. MH60]PPS89422.1 hypothetical protein BZZ08_01568 [Streptomyces sp. MH60]
MGSLLSRLFRRGPRPSPAPDLATPEQLVQRRRVVVFLRKNGRSTLEQISAGTGIAVERMPNVLAFMMIDGYVDLVVRSRGAGGQDLYEATAKEL